MVSRKATTTKPISSSRLTGGEHNVITFAFAQEDVFAEQEIIDGDGALEVAFTDIVQVHAAAFHVLSGPAFGWGEAGMNKEFDQGGASAFQFAFFDFLGGPFADNV